MRLPCLLLSLLIPAAAGASETTRMAVLPLAAGHGVEMGVADVATDALVTALQSGGVQAITLADIQRALGFESEKARLNVELAQRMGDAVCVENQACLTELGGALGAALLVSGTASRIGSSLVISVQLFDQRRAQVLARLQRTTKSDDDASFIALAGEAAGALLEQLPSPPRPDPALLESGVPTVTPAWSAPASLQRAPTGSACELKWRAYVTAAFSASPLDASRAATKRRKTLAAATRLLPMVQDPAQRSALEFAVSELYVEEFLHRLASTEGGRDVAADTLALGFEALRLDRGLLQLPSFARWAETLFRSSLVHYVLGDLRSAELLCRRVPPAFRPVLPAM